MVSEAWTNPWSPPAVPGGPGDSVKSPLYVAVVGNTGSGKSTLVRRLADQLDVTPVIAIDERDTHHPFLDRLFEDPARFAFELQVNFMIQRVLIVKRWLAAGVQVVMERSHYDDPVFINHLAAMGLVTEEETAAYLKLWDSLEKRLPPPDLVVYMRVPSAVSIERITAAEDAGERPREFASESQKHAWVEAWWRWYEVKMKGLASDNSIGPCLLFLDGTKSLDELTEEVEGRLHQFAPTPDRSLARPV